jgi:hypothetical protein
MSLHEKLKKHRIKFEEHAKPEILEVMRRAKNTAGEMIRSKDILADRLIVLTFYRGTW